MADPRQELTGNRINPTTPERQVAAFGVELDKLLYRFGCEFDIEPEDYAAVLMQASDDILHQQFQEVDEVPGLTVRFIDGPLAGELYELNYPPGYDGENCLFWEGYGTRYRLQRLASGMWQGFEI